MYGYSDYARSVDLKEYPERFRTMAVSFPTKRSGSFGYICNHLCSRYWGPVHTTLGKSGNATITGRFRYVFEENPGGGITGLWWHHRFRKAPVHTKKETPTFSNSSGLKSVFEKLRFRDGLVWTVDLTIEIKLRYVFKFLRRGVDKAWVVT